jgi:hypothetical protein
MKYFIFLVACLFTAQAASSQLRITEVMSNGGTSDWFELTNYGTTAVSISGYKMDDNSFSFATSVVLNGISSIGPGERVIFCENANTSYPATFRTFWGLAESIQVGTYTGTGIGLSSSGDGVIVFDATGLEVWRVNFGAATAGKSFYWGYDLNGNFDPNYVGSGNVGLVSALGTVLTQNTFTSVDVIANTASPGTSIQPFNPVLGCTDVNACNYNSTATTDDGTCQYALIWYVDADGDGFGTNISTTENCVQPSGYVGNFTDCEDSNFFINPGVLENCLNLTDDNCDGLINTGCPQPEFSIASSSNFIQVQESAGSVAIPITVSLSSTFDINLQFSYSIYSDATEGTDFEFMEDIVIPANTSGIFNHVITILDDADLEKDERVILKIQAVSYGTIHATNNYRIIFIDDNEQDVIAPSNELSMNLISSFSNGTAGVNSAEIVAYCSLSERLFIANSVGAKMDIVDFSNPSAPSLITSISMTPYGNINSIAIHEGIVAVAIENSLNPQDNGKVVFFDYAGNYVNEVAAGAMPDMITFSKDYTKVLTANEGEPNGNYSLDPEGSVTVINIANGIANLTPSDVTQISLTQFNGQEASLRSQGIRIFSSSASVAQDLEPEYIAVSDDNSKAFVTCQENNAILEIDLVTNTIIAIHPCGYASYAAGSGNALDASDQSGAILNTSNLPIKGAYMPDAISYSTIGGQGYLFTANEGDSREFGTVIDANRISSSTFNNLDATAFPEPTILRNNKFLGRLSGLKYSGDTDGDGDYDELHVLGSRSFTIRDASTNSIVFDSKDLFERITANSSITSTFFNASNTTGAAVSKNRSDDKGPEPEGITTAVIGGIHYAFVALERVGGCMVFNVENPQAPVFVNYVNNRTLNGSGPDLGAEGIIFIPSSESPNGQNIVILANEVSSTLSIFSVSNCAELAYYQDSDGDTFGNPGELLMACEQPTGYVLDNADCNDSDALINPNTAWYLDSDDDGFYVSSVVQCEQPSQGYTIAQSILGDCDDSNAAVNSLANEVCNAIDDNCNGEINEAVVFNDYFEDLDNDGFGFGAALNACQQPAGYVSTNSDCDDMNMNINPSASETCNALDDNCNNLVDEGVQSTFFVDSDADGFGSNAAILACAQAAGFALVNGDCNDNNGLINPNATESCANAFDDDCDGLINEGCVNQLIGDNFTNPQSIAITYWPNCSSTTHSLAGYVSSPNAQSICITGEDKWHQFVANSEAVSIQVNSTSNDIVLELQSASGTLIAIENAVLGIGNEILNAGGLTAGQVYKIAVRNYDSSLGIGTYSICVKSLRRGGCDSGNSPTWSNNLNLCNVYKASWAGSGTQYRFTFTGVSGIATGNVYTRTQSSDLLPLSNVQPTLPLGCNYQVQITNIYTLQNGLGATEVIEVPSLTSCQLNLQQQPITSLRLMDRCENGPRFRSGVVYSLPWVCGVNNWKWEFTLVDAGLNPIALPIVHYRNAASNVLNLGTVSALQAGQTYAVRTAPVFSWGDGQFGPMYYLCIIGSASSIAVKPHQDSNKVLIQEGIDLAIYPNPTIASKIQIQISGIEMQSLVVFKITNDLGQQVHVFQKWMNNNEAYSLSDEIILSAGLYHVEAMVNNNRIIQRLIILN